MGGYDFLDYMSFRMTCIMIAYVLREVIHFFFMRFSVSCESLLFTVGGYCIYFLAVSLSGRIILLLNSCEVGLFSLISSKASNLFFSSI